MDTSHFFSKQIKASLPMTKKPVYDPGDSLPSPFVPVKMIWAIPQDKSKKPALAV